MSLTAVGRAESIDVLDPMLCKLVDALWIATQSHAIGQVPRNAAIGHHTRDRADGVGAAVEPDQKDTIALFIKTDDSRVAIDNSPDHPKPRRHAREVAEPSHAADLEVPTISRRAETGIVKSNLFGWFDFRVQACAAGAVELVNIVSASSKIHAAGLARTVGKDHNILRHCPLQKAPRIRPCFTGCTHRDDRLSCFSLAKSLQFRHLEIRACERQTSCPLCMTYFSQKILEPLPGR
jgi:hypothetical protein